MAAHAAPDGVDAPRVHSQPGQRGADDLGHGREIGYLSPPTPRGKRQLPPLTAGADKREGPARGELPPLLGVDGGADVAAVRRDHERQNRGRATRAEARGKEDDRGPNAPVVGAVADVPALDPVAHRSFRTVTWRSPLPMFPAMSQTRTRMKERPAGRRVGSQYGRGRAGNPKGPRRGGR